MHSRRLKAFICLVGFGLGLFSTTAAPLMAQDAAASTREGWGLSQQMTGGSLLPNVIGGVTGLAIGGATFGVVGAMAGAVGGWALGQVVQDKLYPDQQTLGYPTQVNESLMASLIPGLAGAVLGAAVVWGMGPLAMIVGGVTGFFLGKLLAKVMFPQLYYGATVYPEANRTFQYRYTPSVGAATVADRMSVAPAAPASTTESLEDLKASFYRSMHDYREALAGGDRTAQLEARAVYLEAQTRYFDAKRAATN